MGGEHTHRVTRTATIAALYRFFQVHKERMSAFKEVIFSFTANNQVCNIDLTGPGTLVLHRYSIWGAPGNGGVPDDSYFTFQIGNLSHTIQYDVSLPDGVARGLILENTGINTSKELFFPKEIVVPSGGIKNGTLSLSSPTPNQRRRYTAAPATPLPSYN